MIPSIYYNKSEHKYKPHTNWSTHYFIHGPYPFHEMNNLTLYNWSSYSSHCHNLQVNACKNLQRNKHLKDNKQLVTLKQKEFLHNSIVLLRYRSTWRPIHSTLHENVQEKLTCASCFTTPQSLTTKNLKNFQTQRSNWQFSYKIK